MAPRLHRHLLLACVAATMLVAGHAFETNTVYKYQLDSVVSARVVDEELSGQRAGAAIASQLELSRSSADELVIKLTNPRLASFNERAGSQTSDQRLNYTQMAPQEALERPFRVYLERGVVRAFDAHKDEPRWVSNFKRGLLSMFNVKLAKDDAELAASSSSSDRYFSVLEKSVLGECETDYLVQQVAPGQLNVTKTRNVSKCKSKFHQRIMPVDSSECLDSERDLQQFRHSSAIFNYQLQVSPTGGPPTVEQVLLDEQSTYSPFGHQAHSHQVSTKSSLRLLSSQPGSSLSAHADDMLRTESLGYEPPEALNFYANVNLDEAHHLANIQQVRASVEQTAAAFEALASEQRAYSAGFEQPATPTPTTGADFYPAKSRLGELFQRANELVGTLNSQELEQLYSKMDDRGELHKKLFWDVMSVAGTNPAFVLMKKLITEGDAPAVKIRDYLTRVSYHLKTPTKALLDEYVSLCRSDKIMSNQQYRRLCTLPLASVIHQHCVKPHGKFLRAQHEGASNATAFKRAQNTCQIATGEEYFNRLLAGSPLGAAAGSAGPASSEGSLQGDKMLAIKLAGELGVKASVDQLAELIRTRDEHPSLRAAAMWNLGKAARVYPGQVKRLAVPYYFDSGELLEVRLAAFYNWLQAGLSLHELETVAQQLSSEPSRQLVLYMNSLLKSLASLRPFPCNANANYDKMARLVLPVAKRALARHAPASVSDSRTGMGSFVAAEFGYGSASHWSAIFSNESSAPVNLFYRTSEMMAGLKLSPLQVSVQAHGLDKLIKRVLGIQGLFADKTSFMDVFSLKRRSKRQTSGAGAANGAETAASATSNATEQVVRQEALEMERELKLAAREFSDVYLAISVSVYGRPVTFFDRDSRELKKMLSDDGTIKIPQIKKLLHSFNNHTSQQLMLTFENLELTNNELGLPLYSSIWDFELKTFRLNSVKLDVEPGFFKDERQGKPPTRLAVALDSRLGRHNELLVSSGLLLTGAWRQVGVGFYKKKLLTLPIKVSLEAQLQYNKLTIKRAPVHDNLLHIRQYPVAIHRDYSPSPAPVSPSSPPTWLPLYDPQDPDQMQPFKLELMSPMALGLKMEGKHRKGQDWSMASWRRYLSSMCIKSASFQYFYSPTGAPLELTLGTTTTEINPTRELSTQLTWRHYHEAGAAPDSPERELEAATSAGGQAKPTTVAYKVALIGGSERERQVSLELAYSRSADRLLHKWRAFYLRTPLDQAAAHAEVTNLCWLGSISFPRLAADKLLKFDLLAPEMRQSANLTSELTFGDLCSEAQLEGAPSRLSVRATFDWSAEQRRLIESLLAAPAAGSDKNPLRPAYDRCMRQRQLHGGLADATCLRLLQRLTELHHVSARFDYKQVPERWTKLASRLGSLYTYARAGYIDELDDQQPYRGQQLDAASGPNELKLDQRAHLEANLSGGLDSDNRKLSYEFDTPTYHVVYKNLPISLPPPSTFPLLGASYYKLVQDSQATRLCLVAGQQVSTFDELNYTMPQVPDGCQKLLAKDCSPEANFAVLGAKVGATGKVVKVYVGQRFKVEFIPDKDGKRLSEIKVNGETVQVEQNKPAPVSRQVRMGARQLEAFNIENNGAYYTLTSKLYRFSVSTDGQWVLVQLSKYYSGKACGLCGDANGDQLLELKAPSSARRTCANTHEFVWSYVLPSTCPSRPANIECAA